MLKTCRFVLIVALSGLTLAAGCSTDKEAAEAEPRTVHHHKAEGTGHAEHDDQQQSHQHKNQHDPAASVGGLALVLAFVHDRRCVA